MTANIPPQFRPLLHYIKIGNDHKDRDQIVYYWSTYYALECAMKIDKSSPEAKTFLVNTLSQLEALKKDNNNVEAITNEVVGQAHLEQVAIKMHQAADQQDRAANFNKNMIKLFYTAGHLVDVLSVFENVDEAMIAMGKYDKWKATYIHNCLKNGQTPVPGPPGQPDQPQASGDIQFNVPQPSSSAVLPPINQNQQFEHEEKTDPSVANITAATGNITLTDKHYAEATKYAKYAISAMAYEDRSAAIDNLQKALSLLNGNL